MGIRFPRQQCIGILNHLLRDVRVKVERRNNRNALTNQFPNGRQQISFQVAFPFNGCGSMKRHQHSIDGQLCLQPDQQFVFQRAVTFVRQWSAGTGTGDECWRDARFAVESLQHSAHGSGGKLQDLLAATEIVALERRHVRGDAAKMIAFNEDRTEGDCSIHDYLTFETPCQTVSRTLVEPVVSVS